MVHLLGALLVAGGGVIVAGRGPAVGVTVHARDVIMYMGSMLLVSIGSILKEKIFLQAREQLDGRRLNVFVVNTFGSLCQVCSC
jgi:hypothetical protein